MTIGRAIAKHGPSNFRMQAICSARSWDDLCAIEKVLIAQHRSRAPNGYNLRDGGEGAFGRAPTVDAIERSAAKHRGKPCHPNTRAAASAFHLGKLKSPEMRAKLSAAKMGKPRNEATKEKIRAYWAARRAAGEFKTAEPYAHSRKAASAMIAKIPLPLSRWIGRAFLSQLEPSHV